jgi:hypothetical protein
MFKWLKISHHDHSGRLRPHEHTSYLPLGLLLMFVGFALTVYTASAVSPGPESGSIGLTGTVPGKPPTTAATIQSPSNQQRFSTSPVTVSGTCPEKTLVEIFKSDIFAGSTPCTDAGTFTLDVDLLIGQNILVARVYDDLNQPGPDSNLVTVFYDALPPQASPTNFFDFGGAQLLLNTDAVYRGVFPEQEFAMPIDILGGTPPYAVNVQWGDSNNKVVPRNDNTTFKVAHTYRKPGTYQISIQATDAGGRVAFLTIASIVNGQPAIAAATAAATSGSTISKLLVLWPMYTGIATVVLSFWLGERREKQILSKRGLLLQQ